MALLQNYRNPICWLWVMLLGWLLLSSTPGHAQEQEETPPQPTVTEREDEGLDQEGAEGEEDADATGDEEPELFDWKILPVVFYLPETSVLISVANLLTWKNPENPEDGRPTSVINSVTYTLRNQVVVQNTSDIFLSNAIYHIGTLLSYRFFPDSFFGIGNDNLESAEERYNGHTVELELLGEVRVWDRLYVGGLYVLNYTTIEDTDPNGQLVRGDILGSRGGLVSGLGMVVTYDHRDHVNYPEHGGFYQLRSVFHDNILGSDFGFTSTTLDLRYFITLIENHVLAMRSLTTIGTGNPPFQAMAELGGLGLMRGFFSGRFRDRTMVAFQGEYRVNIAWGFGAAVFGSLGQVAANIGDVRVARFRSTGGLGLRYRIIEESKINLRLDVGFGHLGDLSFGVYFNVLEAF